MLYILTFTAGIAVAAVLMWYFVGMTTRHARSPKARLEFNAGFIYAALIRAGRDPVACQRESIALAKSLIMKIEDEAGK